MYIVTVKIEKRFEYIIKEKSNNIEKEKIKDKIYGRVNYVINNNQGEGEYGVLVDIETKEEIWFEDKIKGSKTKDDKRVGFTIIIKSKGV